MKISAIILFLASAFFANAQSYTFPILPRILDLPGPSFLMAHSEGAKIYIQEIDENLGELWIDSMSFAPYTDSIYINSLIQFGSTNEYLLTTKRVTSSYYPSPSYLWTSPFDWDYQFSTVSISNQEISSTIRDTFYTTGSLTQMAFNDSLIYTMEKQTMICYNVPQFQCDPFTISSSLDYGPLTNMVNCVPKTASSIQRFDDDIQWFFVHQDDMKMMYFDSVLTYQGSIFESIPTTIVSSWPNAYNAYHKRLNRDSILVVNEWTASAGGRHWQLNFFSEDLHTISSIEIVAPTIPNIGKYRMHKVRLAGDYLYVLGLIEVPGVDHWTVFVYDFDMTLQCEISAVPWAAQNTASTKSIVVLNDKAYFSLTDANKQDLFEVSCQTSSLGEIDPLAEIRLYPNPAFDKISIKIESGENPITGLSIVDVNGKTIRTLDIDQLEIEIADLQKGLYFMRIEQKNGRLSFGRFVKE